MLWAGSHNPCQVKAGMIIFDNQKGDGSVFFLKISSAEYTDFFYIPEYV
jgi:hypothetical protein